MTNSSKNLLTCIVFLYVFIFPENLVAASNFNYGFINQSQEHLEGAYQCLSGHCVYLPLLMNSVPEVDIPECRWLYIPGQLFFISYKWGNRLQSPGTLWRNAFESGISSWNNSLIMAYYYFDNSSGNIINTYDDDSPTRGITNITCIVPEGTTVSVEIMGNIYWDIINDYTVNQRQGIAAHEVGHGISIGHIPADYPIDALMYDVTPLEYFSSIFVPQLPDIWLVNHVYP
jgi:hypothetical protein